MTASPLRVLALIETLGRGGGAEQLMISLIPALRSQGALCDVLTMTDWPDGDMGPELEAVGHRVIRLGMSSGTDWPSAVVRARRILRLGRYDVLWSNLYRANILAGLVSVDWPCFPLVISFHGNRASTALTRSEYAERWVGRHLARSCVANSVSTANEYRAAYELSNVAVVYNGVDTSRAQQLVEGLRVGDARKQFDLPEDAFVIVVPSRFVPKKGHAILISALEQLKREGHEPFVLGFGYGPLREELQDRSRQLGLSRVRFEAPIEFENLLRAFRAANLVVMPSIREPFGLAAVEAMSTSTPILVSRVDGLLEIVGNTEGACLSVEAGNVGQLVDQIRWGMENPGELEVIGLRGRKRAAAFDIARCAAGWRDVLFAAAGR